MRAGVGIGLAVALAAGGCKGGSAAGGSDLAMAATDMALPAPIVRSYAVGVTSRTFVDTTRPTPQNGSEPAKPSRTLVTEIWYPSGTMMTPADAGSASPVIDAPLAPGGPYPLALFVHGSGSSRLSYTDITGGLARAGFVVAAADFPLTAMSTPGGSSDLHVTDQVGDLRFLCDQLGAAAADKSDALAGAVDGLHYAVVGHSTGGAVAALAAFAGDDALVTHDPRVSAVVPLSGDACMFSASFFKKRTVPILVVGGTDDAFVRLPNSGQWVFDNTNAPHLLAKLIGGQHIYFTDVPLADSNYPAVPTDPTSPLSMAVSLYGDASECLPEPAVGTDPPMAFDTEHALTVRLVAAWLDAQMRQEQGNLAALLAAHDPLLVFEP